jgi:hypothetical protein
MRFASFGAIWLGATLAASQAPVGQSPAPFPGTLDEHPAIAYEERAPRDRVARLRDAVASGRLELTADAATGYLRPVLKALDISETSQLLVFSKTGLQREFTGPANPRALYFNSSVVVGYIPGAPSLEIAAHDPQQGVMFYTLDQRAPSPAPAVVRRTNCLTCHVSVSTLEVPGFIVRSNMVDGTAQVMPELGSFTVDHRTPHTERWGGWFVTGQATAPPYGPLGHLGNITVSTHPTSGASIFSNQVFIEWMNRPSDGRYPSSESDLGALLAFDHQARGLNLITRLNWEARVAGAGSALAGGPLEARVNELAEYLLFVGEAPLAFEVTPRAGFAEAVAAWAPADSRGRSCAQMDLTKRLSRYSCSYLLYSEAFASLPQEVRRAVYRRMFAILDGKVPAGSAAQFPPAERQVTSSVLRETLRDPAAASIAAASLRMPSAAASGRTGPKPSSKALGRGPRPKYNDIGMTSTPRLRASRDTRSSSAPSRSAIAWRPVSTGRTRSAPPQ